jgi:hypothetical protein
MKQFALLLLALLAATAAGCNGGNDKAATQPPPTTTSETTTTGTATLERAARQALRENDQLSGYVLWNNRLPAWATRSTRGPALATLRRSAADRRKRGIRVRTLVNRLEITSVKLDPSYTKAAAAVRSIQRVRPYRGGKPIGRAVKLDERATIELRRLGPSSRFVVWRVRVLG